MTAWRALAIAAVLLTSSCSSSGTGSGGVTGAAPDLSSEVVYLLTGSAEGADITYSAGGGGTEQQQGVAVPMKNKRTGLSGIRFNANFGDFLYFSAQNTGEFGSLTCEITVDGDTISRHTSSGAYSIVTCDGSV
jgi:hypothetical protein